MEVIFPLLLLKSRHVGYYDVLFADEHFSYFNYFKILNRIFFILRKFVLEKIFRTKNVRHLLKFSSFLLEIIFEVEWN